MKLLSPDARAERRLAICLALVAGYVDTYGFIALGVYVSFRRGVERVCGGPRPYIACRDFAVGAES
jgi:hypothetical protein